ncbi:hypothetical protein SDC9_202286 [bioreactor metagenome]|uniref:Uncharacterized protein n=1 Tax=bioreactor metagenome TaxID=1076179 RepID=A0A645IT70_9ZZZZ
MKADSIIALIKFKHPNKGELLEKKNREKKIGRLCHHVNGRKRIGNQYFAGAYFAAYSISDHNKGIGHTGVS